MKETEYTTDDLAFAATLAALGATVKGVEWRPDKRRSDIILDLSTLDLKIAAGMARNFATRLESMSEDISPDDLEVSFRGTIIHHCFTWLNDLRQMVLRRRK